MNACNPRNKHKNIYSSHFRSNERGYHRLPPSVSFILVRQPSIKAIYAIIHIVDADARGVHTKTVPHKITVQSGDQNAIWDRK